MKGSPLSEPNRTDYSPLSPRLMLQLAAPHTWAASIFPVLIALALAVAMHPNGSVSSIMACVLLAISVLFQSAVNTANDYFDYKKGVDTVENQPDPTDAVLVYNRLDPRSVRNYAIGLVGIAFLLGSYCVALAGALPLVIAGIGVAVVFLYSGGRTPLSYLPLGELASGFTMGGLITFASYYCLTLSADPMVFVYALPLIIGIALIMLTNNACDREKDAPAGRKTLPVLIGYDRTVVLYHALVYLWISAVCVIVLVWFTKGWAVLPFMLLAVHPLGRALLSNPLTSQSRAAAFAQCTGLNVALGGFYAAAIFASLFEFSLL